MGKFSVAVLMSLWLCGCASTATFSERVAASSAPKEYFTRMHITLPKGVPAADVQVLDLIPDRKYLLLDTNDYSYSYPLGSMTYEKFERESCLKKCREWAGNLGANAVIVEISQECSRGGAMGDVNVKPFGVTTGKSYVVQSDTHDVKYVTAHAVFMP